ncbi:bZIP transcription factor AP-1/Yap1, putative [Talaromyces stipitatus ATCC 10500]|uniref:BZIP transcription factor AP-1/Yap1, putative n=1 Tax=Talaromyces stipitatus (strain ATCC 10500 / CBS 375.48 / QM 6759 / NRRL 1006) TaxID=441959 RepID=B8M178_TALSN|nr:bZIP transcription factor AP-1/Yap1, putative [Talaromyces stipitatus ATCC 10500]EED21020.1 bZIP transcription factor AP-1/Yap1, putative [Talaromyces stipitatus ATCC 10500]
MTDFNSIYQQNLYLSPEQQNLLMAALNSNNASQKQVENEGTKNRSRTQSSSNETTPSNSNGFDPASSTYFESPLLQDAPGSGHLGFGSDESPFLDFDPDVDFDFQGADQLIGDLPDFDGRESGDKRKSLGGNEEDASNGKKRRESDDKDKAAKKPGRKPLTSEPTTKRKAQNRAAQRAFRERKEKHLKDLETKVEELEKASQNANQENGLLRAQVERLQVELKEYRKRISWLSGGNGLSTMAAMSSMNSRNLSNLNNNDFYFDFPKFGDLPGKHMFSNNGQNKQNSNSPSSTGVSPTAQASDYGRNSLNSKNLSKAAKVNGLTNGQSAYATQLSASSAASNTDSPSASSDSQHGQSSSIGTSPEPSLNSPNVGKPGDSSFDFYGNEATTRYGGIDGEKSFCEKLGMACGNINNPMPAVLNKNNDNTQLLGQLQPAAADQSLSFDWLAQQNGGSFDPVLFNDYREPQDAVLSQDFGAFFNDAFPLPDLGSPFADPSEVTDPKDPGVAKKDNAPSGQKPDDEDEVVPGEDKTQIMSCTNIWDRLQSMEKFRNGEIDIDSLCTELRTKARCSEGGVVVYRKDVDDIVGRAGNEMQSH